MTFGEAVQWARPAIAELVAGIAETVVLETLERLIRCDNCEATWIGHTDDTCRWCQKAEEWMRDDTRNDLLWPAWATDHGARYHQLSDTDQTIWDRTRGINRGDDDVTFWAQRLGRAVKAGLVNESDAELAVKRIEKWAQM